MGDIVQEIYWKLFFSFRKCSCATLPVYEVLPLRPLTLLTEDGKGSSEWQRHSWKQLLSVIAALLRAAPQEASRGKRSLTGCGRKRLWPNMRDYPGVCWRHSGRPPSCYDSWRSGRDIWTEPTCSVAGRLLCSLPARNPDKRLKALYCKNLLRRPYSGTKQQTSKTDILTPCTQHQVWVATSAVVSGQHWHLYIVQKQTMLAGDLRGWPQSHVSAGVVPQVKLLFPCPSLIVQPFDTYRSGCWNVPRGGGSKLFTVPNHLTTCVGRHP